MKRTRNVRSRKFWIGSIIVEVLTLALVAVGAATVHSPVDAEEPNHTEHNQAIVAEQFAPLIAANPEAATLDPELQARVDQISAATKPDGRAVLTPDERGVFIAGVQAAVIKIRNGEHGPTEQAQFAAALREFGYTPAQAEALKADPIAMNAIPVFSTEQPTVPGDRTRVEEQMFTGPDGKEYGFSNTAAPGRCPSAAPNLKSTHPQMYRSWQSYLGFTLASVSWYRTYCWGSNVVSAVSGWEDPHFNPTGNCLGCEFETSWHTEYYYDYNGNPWSGYANKVNFNIKSCVGWIIGQCMTNFHYWQMNMHGDATLWWTYDRA